MYEIFPKSLKEFIEDPSIKLPRFQRKASWDYKKRFELALSIFKNYPVGCSILSKENDGKKNLTEWLLDGRQRRDTIKAIYEDPENLYLWGKKYLPIKKGDSVDTISENFWNKVADFIEEEDAGKPSLVETESGLSEGGDIVETESENLNDSSTPETESTEAEELAETSDSNKDEEELGTLLTIIRIAFEYQHGGSSGLSSSFDLKEFLQGKAFNTALYDDREKVVCAKLRKFLQEYKGANDKTYRSYDVFIQFLDSRFDWVNENSKAKLKSKLSSEWAERQLKIIDCFDKIDAIFLNRKIAIIETHDITSTDSQKIFNLINTGGTKLTASEILSAKPKWNTEIKAPSSKFEIAIEKLYGKLDLGNSGKVDHTVKWDVPAASTYFFDAEGDESGFSLFFHLDEDDVASRITIGFKLLSGFFTDGVKKENIDSLSTKIDWNNYEDNLKEIKDFLDGFKNSPYLKTIRSWGKSLSDVLSDGPTMSILFLLFRSWKDLGKPTGFSTEAKKLYDKNVFIQLDNGFYSYLSNQWKGSSDSTISRNIAAYSAEVGQNSSKLFDALPEESWKSLLNNLITNNTINGKPITKGILAPLVYFYNVIINKNGSGISDPGEIDHIIPQSAWSSSSLPNKESIQNNAFNLSLLPKTINASKNDQLLSSVAGNASIANAIGDYEEISVSDFGKYSQISNYSDLKKVREALYIKAFTKIRDGILQNS